MTNEVKFIDTTVRDGNQSLWALNMRVGAMLPALPNTSTKPASNRWSFSQRDFQEVCSRAQRKPVVLAQGRHQAN